MAANDQTWHSDGEQEAASLQATWTYVAGAANLGQSQFPAGFSPGDGTSAAGTVDGGTQRVLADAAIATGPSGTDAPDGGGAGASPPTAATAEPLFRASPAAFASMPDFNSGGAGTPAPAATAVTTGYAVASVPPAAPSPGEPIPTGAAGGPSTAPASAAQSGTVTSVIQASAIAVANSDPAFSLTYKGFNYVADYNGAYSSHDSLSDMISSTGANAVALTEDYGINAVNSTVFADSNITETISALKATGTEAKTDGLSVMVRPLIDFTDNLVSGAHHVGDWRAYYEPTNADTFFASYKTMIVAQATAAQAIGAPLFCIGTELDQLTGSAYLAKWTDIITAVKAVYTGKLTYSAIWDDSLSPWQYGGAAVGTGDITTQVSFWSQLDYVGLDVYAPLSDAGYTLNPDGTITANGGAAPTEAQLVAGWNQIPTDPTTHAVTGAQSLISYFESVSTAIGKPLLFTELGFNSAPDAAVQPFFTSSSTYDPALQAELYQSFFTAWKGSGDTSLKGVYIWNWEPWPANPSLGLGSSPNWTPQGGTGVAGSLAVLDAGFTACYAAGTRITTTSGETVVEDLRPGNRVKLARGGSAPVVWLGHRRVACGRHPRPWDVMPVRVRAGAFADGRPARDLLLSPDHAVYADGEDAAPGVLIPVRYLLNGASIVQEEVDAITYWHVELPTHDVILADGLPAESYLDTGNRGAFANGGGAVSAHPDFARGVWQTEACAPLVTGGPHLAAVKARLIARLPALGFDITDAPDLCCLVDGIAIEPQVFGAWWCMALPDGPRRLTLRSRRARPAELDPASDDTRLLGVAVRAVRLDGVDLPLDDSRFAEGWHAAEPGMRWTDGAAVLHVRGASVVELMLGSWLRFHAAGHTTAKAA